MTRDAAVFRHVADSSFLLMPTTQHHFVEFAEKDGYNAYFQDLFAASRRLRISSHLKWEWWFAQLGDIGTLKGKVPTGVMMGVMRLFTYGSRAQLEALAKLCDKDESETCFERAKEGFVRLFGADHSKSVEATHQLVIQITEGDELIAKLRALWERVKVTLPDEAVTYEVATTLGVELHRKGKDEGAKLVYLAALEGRRRVLGAERKDTLATLKNSQMWAVLQHIEDYEGALDFYQQALRGYEKVLGKTHLDTLLTIMNMAITYGDGLGDQVKEEEMYRLALDGYEELLGKGHTDTKRCARNLAVFLDKQKRKIDLRKALDDNPHLEDDDDWDV